MLRPSHLHVVSRGPDRPDRASISTHGDRGDVAVMAMLFGVNLVPLVGEAVARGRWGPGTLGLAAAGALVTGRELVLGARSLLRRRR